jgi:hypothetical protein
MWLRIRFDGGVVEWVNLDNVRSVSIGGDPDDPVGVFVFADGNRMVFKMTSIRSVSVYSHDVLVEDLAIFPNISQREQRGNRRVEEATG